LDAKDIFIDLLSWDVSSVDYTGAQMLSLVCVNVDHKIVGVENLGGEVRDGEVSVVIDLGGVKGRKCWAQEVKTVRRNEIDSVLSQVNVQLSWESKGTG